MIAIGLLVILLANSCLAQNATVTTTAATNTTTKTTTAVAATTSVPTTTTRTTTAAATATTTTVRTTTGGATAAATTTMKTTTVAAQTTLIAAATTTLPQTTRAASSAIPSTTRAMTTTVNPNSFVCGTMTCIGYGFYSTPDSTSDKRCVSIDYSNVTYCDTVSNVWRPVASSTLYYIPCRGDFKFTVVGVQYWLNDTLKRWNGATWNELGNRDIFYYNNYLARLRPSEGTGSFHCHVKAAYSPNSPSLSWYAYYYNGTYYDLVTDSLGVVKKQAQSVQQYARYYIPFFTRNETSCSPVCAWFQDTFTVVVSGSSISLTTEMMFNGSKWQYWQDGSYKLYTGEFTSGMIRHMNQFNDFSWKLANGTRYKFTNGTVYQLGYIGIKLLPVMPLFNWDFWTTLDFDPTATGGLYYTWQTTDTGMYKNISGDYWCNIKNGVFTYQRRPPSCDNSGYKPGWNSNPSCASTEDRFKPTQMIVCDPAQTPSICGQGFKCVTLQAALGLSCQKGFCVPDFDKLCSATTTQTLPSTTTKAGNTTVPPRPLGRQKYGLKCSFAEDCHTGICNNGTCACTNCTKVLPGYDWDWKTQAIVYKERCVPKNSTTVGLGDVCSLWADVPQSPCGMGLICSKCPEMWNSPYVYATCVAPTLPQEAASNTKTCPETFKCGYKASCKMILDNPTCVCDDGYSLEEDVFNCYAWSKVDDGECITEKGCGLGIRRIKRKCDKVTSSKACPDYSYVNETCSTGAPCPLDVDILPAAVRIEIKSKILDAVLFTSVIEAPLRDRLASAITQKCLDDKDTYENQCCRGKAWKSKITDTDCIDPAKGLGFLGIFKEGDVFSFYLTATGNSSSNCCKNGGALNARKRRSAGPDSVDQNALANIVSDVAVLDSMTSVIQYVDASATVPASAVSVATTTTTSTTTVSAAYQTGTAQMISDGTIGGLAVWLIGVIAGVAGFVIIIIIVIVVVIVAVVLPRKRAANKVAAAEASMIYGGYRPPVETRISSSAKRYSTATVRRSDDNIVVSDENDAAYPPYYGKYPSPKIEDKHVVEPQPAHDY